MAVTLVKLNGTGKPLRDGEIDKRTSVEYRLDLSREQYSLLYDAIEGLAKRGHFQVRDWVPEGRTSIRRVLVINLSDGPVTPLLQTMVERRLSLVLQHALHG